MNVVQQRMHLRQAFKFHPSFQYKDGVWFFIYWIWWHDNRFFDYDNRFVDYDNRFVDWHDGPRATSCDTTVAKYDATKWPSVLISIKTNVVQQRMHLRHATKSARSTFGLDVSKIGVLVTSADTHDLVLPLATLRWQNMMQYSGHTCWSAPKWMLCNNECT